MEVLIEDRKLIINLATTRNCIKLISFLAKNIKKELPDFELNDSFKLEDFFNKNKSKLINMLVACVEDSEELYNIFLDIASNCIFNNEKITENLLNEKENKKYFTKIVYNILLENIKVFF